MQAKAITEFPLSITAAFSPANMSPSTFGGSYARKSRCMSIARSNDYSPAAANRLFAYDAVPMIIVAPSRFGLYFSMNLRKRFQIIEPEVLISV
jgi:hypothetical protein